jgi:tetratricopeptide (TPR) repeat protein
MRGELTRFFLLMTVASCCHPRLLAAGQMGSVEGYVRTKAGKGIPAARVLLDGGSSRSSFSIITDSRGNYRVTAAVGTYRVEVAQRGYATATEFQLVVSDRARLRVNFVLKPSSQGNFSKSSEPSVSAIHLYDPSGLVAGQLTNPAAGGGYSNSAAMRSGAMVEAYLSTGGFLRARPQGLTGSEQVVSALGLARLQQLTEEEPTEANFQRWGSALLARQNYALATHVFQQSLARYNGSAQLWIGLGISLYSQGRYNQATQGLIRAAQIEPANPQVYDFLVQSYHSAPRTYATVAGLLEQFVRSQPRNPHARYDYAIILWRNPIARQRPNRLRNVESEFKTAIALDPRFAEARFQLGVLYDQEKITRLAIRQYQTAIRLRPGFAKAHYRLAEDYVRTGKEAQASTELTAYEKLVGQRGSRESTPARDPGP